MKKNNSNQEKLVGIAPSGKETSQTSFYNKEDQGLSKYNPIDIEKKWQQRWGKDELYNAKVNVKRKKYYCLTMLPYPSGDLHIGHWYAMTPSDARARYLRMNGYNVMYPIGFDAFGDFPTSDNFSNNYLKFIEEFSKSGGVGIEKNQLEKFVGEAFKAAEKNPILIDKFINHAMEIDVDAISDGKQVHVAGIMQHIEEAGIHSGDSACCLPPVSIKPYLIKEIENQTKKLALALKVKGFMNIQFAIKKDKIFVIEVNPRASRTVPFVSKAKGLPFARIASRVMAGEKLSKFNLKDKSKNMYAVKEAVFPFNKFPNSDLLLGPEMKSTGEVMGFDKNFGMAFAKSQIASANSLPKQGLAFISLKNSHKDEGIGLAKQLIKLKFTLCATQGTAKYIRKFGMKCRIINKVSSGSPHIVDVLNSKKIAIVINTGGGNREYRISDAIALRRATLKNKVPYCTNMSTAQACLGAIKSLKTEKLEVKSLQDN